MAKAAIVISDDKKPGFSDMMKNIFSVFRGDTIQNHSGHAFQAYIQLDSRVGDGSVVEYDDGYLIELGINYSRASADQKRMVLLQNLSDEVRSILDGEACILYLSKSSKKVILVTDAFGLFPIYYHIGEGQTLISTDLMGILGISPDLRQQIDNKSVLEFLSCHFIMENRTLFSGLNLVNEGMITTIDCKTDEFEQKSWLKFPLKHEERSLDSWIETVSSLLSKSIEKRVSSNCGTYLSGGMDSRVVLASIPESVRKRMRAITFGVEGADDCRIARRVADRFQIDLHHMVLETDIFTDNFLKHIWLSGGISNHMVAPIAPAVASIKVNRIFDGFAGDAQFGGGFHDTSQELDDGQWKGNPSKYILEKVIQKGYIRPMDEILLIAPNHTSEHILEQLRESISGELSRFQQNTAPSIVFEMILFRLRAKGNTLGGQISADSVCPVMKPFYDLEFANTIMQIPSKIRRKHIFYNHYVRKVMPAALGDSTTTILPLEKRPKFTRFIKRIVRFIARKFGMEVFEKKGWIPIDKWIRENRIYYNWMKGILLDARTSERGYIDPLGAKELLRKEIVEGRKVAMTLVNAVDLELIMRLYADGDGYVLFAAEQRNLTS